MFGAGNAAGESMDDDADVDSDGAAEDDAEAGAALDPEGAGLASGTATHADSTIPAAINANASFGPPTAGSPPLLQS